MPGAAEVEWRGEAWFQVGRKAFALSSRGRTIMKLDKGHQELLFEVRPKTFEKCPVGTSYWSYVALENLDADELADLVLEAWSMVVPKRVSRPFLSREPGEGDRSPKPAKAG